MAVVQWDPVLTRAVARELSRELTGRRTVAVHMDRSEGGVRLHLRDALVEFTLRADRCSVLVLPASPPGAEARRLPARVASVESPVDERILLLRMRRVRGTHRAMTLVIEWIPRRLNAFVLRGDALQIVSMLRPVGRRGLRVGAPYEAPPARERLGGTGALSLEEWQAIVSRSHEGKARSELLRTLAWTSSVNAAALVGDDGTEGTAKARWALWRSLIDPPPGGFLLEREEGPPQPYPVALPGLRTRPLGSLLAAMAAVHGGLPGLGHPVLRTLDAEIERTRARERRLRSQLDATPDPDELRATANLLLARLRGIPRGRARVELEGFGGETVAVTLDPARSPRENADRMFERAAKAERAREGIPTLLDEVERRIAELSEARRRAEGPGLDDPGVRADIARLLPDGGGPRSGRSSRPPRPYRLYRSSGGLQIRVGRSARSNDDLTFHHSDPSDVWMHARDVGGAHVVLRWASSDPPPSRDLREAAGLAALHSRARHSGLVPVDWTRRKHVRKPRGARPGSVRIERERTLFVEPDPGLEERLRDDVQGPDRGPADPQVT